MQQKIASTWIELQTAWRAENAAEVNAKVATIAGLFLRASAPERYPNPKRLSLESWYFRSYSMTWVWFIYLTSVIPLLMSVIYKWDRARTVGMVMFFVAFAAHSVSIGIRWYISGRWPNSNMFEAVTTSVWFGGVVAMVLEHFARRTPLRNLFALGSAAASMTALMAAYFLPADLDSSISNKMAALHDVWLYIHTNMIIMSYALIALAAVTALLQLRHRWCLAWDSATIPKLRLLMIPVALALLNYTAYRLMMHYVNSDFQGLGRRQYVAAFAGMAASALIVFLELRATKQQRAAGVKGERSSAGGAATLMMGPGRGPMFLNPAPPTAGQVFDGATMVLMELSFITLWTGLVMGAIWADHSWGRPWGWDPKEVFALNTFIIFLILVHTRLKVRDKGFWTAVLAVIGFEVMMFNWIVINFIVSGLHSYA